MRLSPWAAALGVKTARLVVCKVSEILLGAVGLDAPLAWRFVGWGMMNGLGLMKKQQVLGAFDPRRRRVLKHMSLIGAAAVTYREAVAGSRAGLSLDIARLARLSAWAETLVPGAEAAGVANFIAAQLAAPRQSACLTLRYLDWAGDFPDFYRRGLDALERSAMATHGRGFVMLADADRAALAGRVASGSIDGWQGPPAGLFYFAVRSDAVDVVYGTVQGFARLNVPYRAHIAPVRPWPGAWRGRRS